MKGCFACLVVVGLTFRSPFALAEEDPSDFFVPAWELPADALQPQNVRKSFDLLVPLPDVLLRKNERAERQNIAHKLNFGGPPLGTTDESDNPGETPASKAAGGTKPPLDKTATRFNDLPVKMRALWADREDDTKDFNQQVAAVVNGGRILNGEILDHCCEWLLQQNADIQQRGGPQSGFNQLREERVREVLPFFIRRRLFVDALEAQMTRQQLREIHVDIDGKLKAEIKKRKRELNVATDKELELALNERGTSLWYFENAFVAGYLEVAFYESVVPEGGKISKQDLLDDYQSHLSDHTVSARVKWDQIQISFHDEAAKREALDRIMTALDELKIGTPVADVAKKYSDGSTARLGGKSAWMNAGSLRDWQLEQMLFEMPIGEWSNPHEGPDSWQLVRVLDRRSARVLPFSKVEEKVRANLEQQTKKKHAEEMFHKMLEEAEIKTEYDLTGLLPAESAADRPADAIDPERGPWLDKEVFLKLNADWKPADATALKDQVMFPATVTDVDGEWLKLGRIWVRASDALKLPAALDYFTDQINLNPTQAACWAGRAAVWKRKGYVDAALADYATVIRLDPNQAMVYCFRGEMAYLRGHIGSAIKDLAEAIRVDPQCAPAYYTRGLLKVTCGNRDAAIKDLTEAVRLDPNHASAYLNRGLVWRGKGNLDAAFDDYSAAIRIDSKKATFYLNRASAWDDKRNFDAAIADYTEAIRLDPKSAEAYNNRGLCYKQKGDIETAIHDCTEAIRLNPNVASTYVSRGVCLGRKRNFDGAISDLTEAIRLDPSLANAYGNRASALAELGQFDAAITDCTKAIQLDPNLAMAYLARGLIWRRKGDDQSAIKDFSEAIRIKPESADSYVYRGSALKSTGDFAAATKDMTEAIRLDPKMAVAYNDLAWQLATCPDEKVRDGKRAVELATKACNLSDWKKWGYIDTLAAAHAEVGDWENAVKRQEQAIELAGDREDKRDVQARLELYRAQKPYRQESGVSKKAVPDFGESTDETNALPK